MLRVDIHDATPGMALSLPVRHPRAYGRVLLKCGFDLTGPMIARLDELGVRSVWVRCPCLSFLKDVIRPEVMAAQGEVVTQISAGFTQAQDRTVARLPFKAYTRAIGGLLETLLSNPQAAIFLGDLAHAAGDDLMRHSSTTAYLALLMGLKLEGYLVKQRRHVDPLRAKEVVNLGVGAMLHDIGVTQLPAETREHYRKTGDDHDPAWREHPTLGYRAVHGKVEPSAATVVLHHHQRFDGSGYAGSAAPVLAGERIHVFARIVGLAEQFDRLRNPPGRPPLPTVAVLAALLSSKFQGEFDPEALRALLSVTPPYPPGTMLRLSDGRWAAAIDHTPCDPCRPVVQIMPPPGRAHTTREEDAGPIVKLREERRGLVVAQSEGQSVCAFNFPAPAIMRESLAVSTW